MGRAKLLDCVPSLQSGLPEQHARIFEAKLGAWFLALKWLLKEFRLHVGYETPDEEAGVRFWIDRYERLRAGAAPLLLEEQAWQWPTANEPGLPALRGEVQQASLLFRQHLELRLTQLFEVRRDLCPETPILVPLEQLKQCAVPRGLSAGRCRAALHQSNARHSRGSSLPQGQRARSPARKFSLECRDRLFPVGRNKPPLSDEDFASRVVDLAIEFDGNAGQASVHGLQMQLQGLKAADASPKARHWCEGRSRLQELNLLSFWLQLRDKAALGVSLPAARAERALAERIGNTKFGDKVIQHFVSRFRYECLDPGALYRFWLAMPPALRSQHHVRGVPDEEAFELLRNEARVRAERKQTRTAPSRPPGKRPWRPGGEALSKENVGVQCAVDAPDVRSSGLLELARPKARMTALPFLKALARRFPQDAVMRKMLKQSLQPGGLAGRHSAVREAYALVHNAAFVKPLAGNEQLSLQEWLEQDGERAQKALDSLKDVEEVTGKIKKFLRREAARYLGKSKGGLKEEEPGLLLVDELFARLCRQLGTAEVVARFEPQDPGSARLKAAGRQRYFQGSGFSTSDCCTRTATCRASSSAAGCSAEMAVDGLAESGWRPDPSMPEANGAWWLADLGRQQSCVSIVLEWTLSSTTQVIYPSRSHLRDDIVLVGGLGAPILVAQVRPGGFSERAGVSAGDTLLLGAGGDCDAAFRDYSPSQVVAQIFSKDSHLQAMLVFESKSQKVDAWDPPPSFTVGVLASRDGSESGLTVVAEPLQLSAVPGQRCEVPALFVASLLRLDFSNAWPCMRGRPLLLSVRVLRAFRLAPPAFRRCFVELLRQKAREKRPALRHDPTRGRRPFWASASKSSSWNVKIREDLERRKERQHDCEIAEEKELLKVCQREKPEFNSLRSAELKRLRGRIFSRAEDVRECTFHPRTAANVPSHVSELREHTSDRFDAAPNIDNFVNSLGNNFASGAYPNYRIVHRRMVYQRARNEFAQGNLSAAMTRLQSQFQVRQIQRRFRCFHRGCGQQLDQTAEVCACGGFYCEMHKPPSVHNCSDMKKQLLRLAQEARNRDLERKERGEEVLPEEKFDNKSELGLILQVYVLAHDITEAMRAKQAQRRKLVHLRTSLEQFGAIRMLERPFRRRMCQSTPNLREAVHCGCPDAHHPSQLRFPAAEPSRRLAAWVAAAITEWEHLSDVLPGSEAEYVKVYLNFKEHPWIFHSSLRP